MKVDRVPHRACEHTRQGPIDSAEGRFLVQRVFLFVVFLGQLAFFPRNTSFAREALVFQKIGSVQGVKKRTREATRLNP